MRYGKVLIALLLVGSMVGIANNGVMQLLKLRSRVARVANENEALTRKNRALALEVQRLKETPYLERLIRSELGFARDNELLFEFGNKGDRRRESP